MIEIATLNDNQREAVLWNSGPLLVMAGPGSGKTRVLTYRIARTLEQSEGQYFRVLALTFTNKAAAEIRSRVAELVPNELNRVRLTTFHSYAAELMQQHGSHLEFRPDFQILSNDADREALLVDVLGTLRKDLSHPLPEHFRAGQLLPLITRLLEHCIRSNEAESILQQHNIENVLPLVWVYTAYRKALRSENCLDFPSLIAETLELLQKHPFLIKHVRKVYKHILVDEFQDTNHAQYRFLALLARPDPSTLFVVADDDQIIYQWNGASTKRIHTLREEFNVSELQLPENYRCPPLVIKMANALIQNNLDRSAYKKPLTAVKIDEGEGVVRIRRFNNANKEVAWIAQDIQQKEPQERAQIAILARTKKLLDLIGSKLEEEGMPVYFAARKNEFKSAPLRMLHAILRLVNSKEDKQSLARLSKAFYELEGILIELPSILDLVSADGQDLLHSWLGAVMRRDELEIKTRNLLEVGIKPLLTSLSYRAFADNLLDWATEVQHGSLQDKDFNEFEQERKVWQQLLSEITGKFEGDEISLHQLLHELDLTSKTPPKPPEAIPCFTIHASKGMEFWHVYLIGLVEDQLPSWAAVKKGNLSTEMQEERRNCFVAITRAQKSLTLTFADHVFDWEKAPSRFLAEMCSGINALGVTTHYVKM